MDIDIIVFDLIGIVEQAGTFDLLYVDYALGSDTTGDGSAGNPYKTIGYATQQLTTGGDIRVAKSPDDTPLTGTIAINKKDYQVYGTDTLFTSELSVGDYILLPDGGYACVSSITDDVTLTINGYYTGEDVSGAPFSLVGYVNHPEGISSMNSGLEYGNPIKILGGWDLSTQERTGVTNYFDNIGYNGITMENDFLEIDRISTLGHRTGLTTGGMGLKVTNMQASFVQDYCMLIIGERFVIENYKSYTDVGCAGIVMQSGNDIVFKDIVLSGVNYGIDRFNSVDTPMYRISFENILFNCMLDIMHFNHPEMDNTWLFKNCDFVCTGGEAGIFLYGNLCDFVFENINLDAVGLDEAGLLIWMSSEMGEGALSNPRRISFDGLYITSGGNSIILRGVSGIEFSDVEIDGYLQFEDTLTDMLVIGCKDIRISGLIGTASARLSLWDGNEERIVVEDSILPFDIEAIGSLREKGFEPNISLQNVTLPVDEVPTELTQQYFSAGIVSKDNVQYRGDDGFSMKFRLNGNDGKVRQSLFSKILQGQSRKVGFWSMNYGGFSDTAIVEGRVLFNGKILVPYTNVCHVDQEVWRQMEFVIDGADITSDGVIEVQIEAKTLTIGGSGGEFYVDDFYSEVV